MPSSPIRENRFYSSQALRRHRVRPRPALVEIPRLSSISCLIRVGTEMWICISNLSCSPHASRTIFQPQRRQSLQLLSAQSPLVLSQSHPEPLPGKRFPHGISLGRWTRSYHLMHNSSWLNGPTLRLFKPPLPIYR